MLSLTLSIFHVLVRRFSRDQDHLKKATESELECACCEEDSDSAASRPVGPGPDVGHPPVLVPPTAIQEHEEGDQAANVKDAAQADRGILPTASRLLRGIYGAGARWRQPASVHYCHTVHERSPRLSTAAS